MPLTANGRVCSGLPTLRSADNEKGMRKTFRIPLVSHQFICVVLSIRPDVTTAKVSA
jgi:hypothetical protein